MPTWQRPPLPVRWVRSTQPAFVGRAATFAVLEGLWRGVLGGLRHTVFVGADAGGGKSRFVAEAALALHEQGAGVLWGASSDGMGLAHDPFVQPVATLLDALRPEGTTPGLPQATLDLLTTLTASTVHSRHEPERMPIELGRALVEALRWATAVRPVVLVLEDLHWAGAAARDLLQVVASAPEEQRLLVLATARDAAPDRSLELSRLTSELYRRDDVHRLDLPGLDTDEIALYLRRNRIVERRDVRRVAAMLRDATGGNPFLLREVCRDLDPRLGFSEREWRLSAPGSYALSVAERLRAMPRNEREVVRLAAVIGEEFDVAEATDAAARFLNEDLTRSTMVTALSSAKTRGLLDPSPGGPGSARFPHALARQAVVSTLTDLELAHAHAAVALTLEEGHPAADRRTVRLAAHFEGAAVLGYEKAATRHLTAAGDLARSSSAHVEAADCYERASRLAGDPHLRDILRLAAARSALLGWQGDRSRALNCLAATSADPELRLLACVGHAATSWRDSVDVQRSRQLLSDALAAFPDASAALAVHATAALARLHAWTGDAATGRRLGAEAISRAREDGDRGLLAKVLSIAINDGSGFEELDRTIARCEELTALGTDVGPPGLLGPACYHRCAAYYVTGDLPALLRAHRDLQSVADLTAQSFWEWVSGAVAFGLALTRADLPAAQAWLDNNQRRLGNSRQTLSTHGAIGIMTFALRRESGLPTAARLILQEPGATGVWSPAGLALASELREPELTRRWLARILGSDLTGLQASASWPATLAYLVEAATWLRDVDAAERLLPWVTRYTGHNLLAGDFVHALGSADLPIATLLSVLGAPGAEGHFEAALTMNRSMGATLPVATTLAAYARHASEHRTPGVEPDGLVSEARALADRHGLVRVHRELDELAALRRPAWGLTTREVEVLGLLGRGLSNRSIAGELVISEHTAANHVRSILAKTQSSNRTQAAMLARRDQPETATREPSGRTR
jgi:DNA-binding CsgD family transcriptional regulator